jgi:hypothetical protein
MRDWTEIFKQADHRVDGMLLCSEEVGLHSFEEGTDGFIFAKLYREGEKVDTVANQAGLASDRLFGGGQGDDEAALLCDAREEDGERTEQGGEEAATLFCRQRFQVLNNSGRDGMIGTVRFEFAAAGDCAIGWEHEDGKSAGELVVPIIAGSLEVAGTLPLGYGLNLIKKTLRWIKR